MRPVFIGDEATAAAYRLAGLDARVATAAEAAGALAAARRASPPLILLGAACAEGIEGAVLEAALQAFAPPLVVVPDVALAADAPDLAARVRGALGIGT